MFREIILPIFRSTRLCVTVCGIMDPRLLLLLLLLLLLYRNIICVLIHCFVRCGGTAFVTCAASGLCCHYGFKQTGARLASVHATGLQPKRSFSSAPYCIRHRSFGHNVQLKYIWFFMEMFFSPSSRRNLLLCATCCKWLTSSRITEATRF